MTNLLIVESPAKAKTIEKYLGKNYEVIASFGHVRDLPSKDGSVEPDNNFKLHYEISPKAFKRVADIVKKSKDCDKLILALDPDREGEAIAWHVFEVLKQKKAIKAGTPVERVVFNAITKNSILEAIKNPRAINMDLVNAQQARRALDYLVGFTLSPILWRKLPGSKSAGRVQSVALRLISDREDEIENFKVQEYWDVALRFGTSKREEFEAKLVEFAGSKLEKFSIISEARASEVKKLLTDKKYQVDQITKKLVKRRPHPPFTTSSLQQEAARKLGFSSKKTMMIAQKLYEGIDIENQTQGLITYMRTDSVGVGNEALVEVRKAINKNYPAEYLPQSANIYKNKVKNAQEAHEAIHPTDYSLSPEKMRRYLDEDQFSLYELIWKRMIASQMADAIFDQVVIDITSIPSYARARAVGTVIKFDGFLKIYQEDKDEGDEEEEQKQLLPELQEKEPLSLLNVNPAQHFTEPPPRYSEASLVKKMEELGIGRPSTYAAIISVLQDRGYVHLTKKRFFPDERGRIVTSFLKLFFPKYLEYSYTAELEEELDHISNGEINWISFLKKFWVHFSQIAKEVGNKTFAEVIGELNSIVAARVLGANEKGEVDYTCPTCKTGKLSLKLGKFGAFLGCSNYPTCHHIRQIFEHGDDAITGENHHYEPTEPKLIGVDPKTSKNILLKVGPYGPYLELEEKAGAEVEIAKAETPKSEEKKSKKKSSKKTADKKPKAIKPKRISIPKGTDLATVDLKLALSLLSLPREVGIHPETGKMITANNGPYGPYVLHDGKFSSIRNENIFEIGVNRAVDLIAENEAKKATRKPFSRFGKKKPGKPKA